MKTTPKPRRLHIDWTRCDGRGLCTELLPGVLRRDDWGYPLARDGSREPAIPPGDLASALSFTVGALLPLIAILLPPNPWWVP